MRTPGRARPAVPAGDPAQFATLRFLLLTLAFAALAAAAPSFSVQGVNRAEFWAFRQDWATIVEDKMDLTARYGDVNGGLGLFLFDPSKPWVGLRQPVRFLDYTVAYSPKQFEILYGKYFSTFGKGLALSTFSDDDFKHYKSLNGLRASAKLPFKSELVLLSGRLRDVFFEENVYKIKNFADSTDQVVGVDLSGRPYKFLGYGARYVRLNRSIDPVAAAFSELFGGNLLGKVGPVEAYGEICQRLGTKPGIGGRDKGLGYYFNAAASAGSYSLNGEYMDYDHLAIPSALYHWNDPPTPIASGVVANNGVDERGFGLTANGTPVGPLFLQGYYGRLYTHDNASAGVVESEGKARYSQGTAWTFEGKFNNLYEQNIELHVYNRNVAKPSLQVNWVKGQHTAAFEGEYGFVSELTDDPTQIAPWKYHEAALALSYGYGANLLFTLSYEHVDMQLVRRYNSETTWPLFETVWSITDRNVLRVRIGSEKGGYTCSGGVCRFETPFTGVKMQLISRF